MKEGILTDVINQGSTFITKDFYWWNFKQIIEDKACKPIYGAFWTMILVALLISLFREIAWGIFSAFNQIQLLIYTIW